MIFNIIAGLAIFGYAGWTLIRYARKTKQGKCAACSLSQSCQTACTELTKV
ncbi:FeoB-associated Cys-rich membrane protein [Paenibacillus sp. N3.4]|uniref:FeoB-associated Cys-rich membrane protein n=1 Tax=Paenibacillus sp. N3.4 TaxID=2603222 RepID=UPI0011C74689|nr:FeoB-associated Cys-rich membrane protein [Paenibacillus sp. N3.4]TXK74011.1 FeoB-associated Cys-rich membrane protein [Paenibacillus sp. N3.4]